jgi:hypothetical protein
MPQEVMMNPLLDSEGGGPKLQQGLSQDSDNEPPPCAEGSVTLSPSSYDYGRQPLDFAVLATFTLCNKRSDPITISNIVAGPTPPYRVTSTDCLGILAAGQSCTITVRFLPTSFGPQPGTLKVYDSAPSSPQTSDLSGTGIPDVSLTPNPCNFPNTIVHFTSFCPVTLTNNMPITLNISQIQTEFGPFGVIDTEANHCGASVAAHQSCYILTTFMPIDPGNYEGDLIVTDDARDSTHQGDALTGTGIGL